MPESTGEKRTVLEAVLTRLPDGSAARKLAPLLFARPPAEDLAPFDPAFLARMAERAAALLADHRPGGSLVRVERFEEAARLGQGVTLVTLVHDDMPFLFDSVTAAIATSAPAIHAVSHPVLDVTRDASGTPTEFQAAGREGSGRERISLIQVAIEPSAEPSLEATLAADLEAILAEVGVVNRDHLAMRARVEDAAGEIEARASREGDEARAAAEREGAALLRWLCDDNFIFLGIRDFTYYPEGEALRRVEGAELGILTDPDVRVLRREAPGASTSAEVRAFLEDPAPLIVAKANARSRVHRRVYMDYVGIKRRDAEGRLVGETRVVGLFASSAYTSSVLSIPLLRRKAETVIERFAFSPRSHSAKALSVALDTYSRDEMFQIDTDLLEQFIGVITELGERPRIRVLPRIDRFDRFASVLVFVPRERYDARLRDEIGLLLAERYDGHVSAWYPAFPEGSLASIHFIIGRRGGVTPQPDPAGLEEAIADLARDWMFGFERSSAAAGHYGELMALAPGLPDGYRDLVPPDEAVGDALHILALSHEQRLAADFYRRKSDGPDVLRLRLYNYAEPLSLSRRVPILENMGFSAVAERSFEVRRPDETNVWLHDMELTLRAGGAIALPDGGAALEATFAAVTDGRIENDGFNALVFAAGLDWRTANMLRAYARYIRQTGFAYTDAFIAQVLERQPAIARDLAELFSASFDPAQAGREDALPDDLKGDGEAERAARRGALAILQRLRTSLDALETLDEDRVARRFLSAILATLRTNFYAVPKVSADPNSRPAQVDPALAFKFDPHLLEGVPAPVPYREIFVFDARVEGVHLRFGPVARGGLRWSDRSQDYRTEVLGLVKAQQVKNAVIVPVGSKGGFYPKRLPDPAQRDVWFEAGRSAYIVFIASLLSVTDNIDAAGETVTPQGVVRHDDLDPYFVVAADKGTATFSDTANAVAEARGFWLGDAFASGGSAGYDHKAMGITARGAWEAVKRHFREMGSGDKAWDIQSEPFTAAGCGDMSGDVFGNGMLLSAQTRLVAAFDHRDIFIDPQPDTAASFAERRRLFDLPRSSWNDYDRSKISAGGGVFSRREKRITLSAEAAEAIGWDKRSGTPQEVISAILRAPVDLLWFGGIGTYVRARSETNQDVGDRANDPVRVTGRDLRAKVIGEGANLALTQQARIEAARAGVRLNTDAIDNSAGVNTSDVEVNIKIALRAAMAAERLTRPDRDTLLASMTDDVARLVLRNNYEQTLALSLEQRAGASRLALQTRLMNVLEETGALDRAVETLPSDAAIADLRAKGQSLTRPELAVLLAYAKIDLFNGIVSGPLPDDSYLHERLVSYFPPAMRQGFAAEIDGHRLRREIVATGLANDLVNRLGPSFAVVLRDATGRNASAVCQGFVLAADGFEAADLLKRIDALDAALPGEVQNELYAAVSLFLQRVTVGTVRAGATDLGPAVAALQERVRRLKPQLAMLASERARQAVEAAEADYVGRGVPQDLAADLALLPLLALVPDMDAVSRETSQPIEAAVRAMFELSHVLRIGQLEAALGTLRPTDYYETLALERAASQIARERRRLAVLALQNGRGQDPVADWLESQGDALRDASEQMARLAGTGETSVSRLTLAAGLLQDLGH
ncbi:NAD-glutamate dehydrogenase [Aureimonas ureilytica]|uniref:NAD-glutamate dehydrogenase n=1 Tax=Aureimonas ureilytica TaxID=401562 RepID=UPI00037E8547|nr:NAD-glutamate dehydrogenase [Aureimonas ureilytica]